MSKFEHLCPQCPDTIQKTCADTGNFPCEERRFLTKEQVEEGRKTLWPDTKTADTELTDGRVVHNWPAEATVIVTAEGKLGWEE